MFTFSLILILLSKAERRGEADGQDDYIQSRSTAIESIESTISELGSIFSQLAGMVAEQRETVQRIDADTTDIAA
jgi:syntaxin 5